MSAQRPLSTDMVLLRLPYVDLRRSVFGDEQQLGVEVRAFRVEKIAKSLALLDRLQNFAEFLHGLGQFGVAALTIRSAASA